MAKRIYKKAKGDAWASPHLEKIAPLLHSRTNRLVDTAASADSLEIENMGNTCHQAKKANSAEAEVQWFFRRVRATERSVQPATTTPGGGATVLLTGGG